MLIVMIGFAIVGGIIEFMKSLYGKVLALTRPKDQS